MTPSYKPLFQTLPGPQKAPQPAPLAPRPANAGGWDPQYSYSVLAGTQAAPGTSGVAVGRYTPGPAPAPQPAGFSGLFGQLGPLLVIQQAMNAVSVYAASQSAAAKVEELVKPITLVPLIDPATKKAGANFQSNDTVASQIDVLKSAVANLAVIDQQNSAAQAAWGRVQILFSGMLDQLTSGDLFGAGNSAMSLLFMMQMFGGGSTGGAGGLFGNLFGGLFGNVQPRAS